MLNPLLAKSILNAKDELIPMKETDEVVDKGQLRFEFDKVVDSEDLTVVEISVVDFCVLSAIGIALFRFFLNKI